MSERINKLSEDTYATLLKSEQSIGNARKNHDNQDLKLEENTVRDAITMSGMLDNTNNIPGIGHYVGVKHFNLTRDPDPYYTPPPVAQSIPHGKVIYPTPPRTMPREAGMASPLLPGVLRDLLKNPHYYLCLPDPDEQMEML